MRRFFARFSDLYGESERVLSIESEKARCHSTLPPTLSSPSDALSEPTGAADQFSDSTAQSLPFTVPLFENGSVGG